MPDRVAVIYKGKPTVFFSCKTPERETESLLKKQLVCLRKSVISYLDTDPKSSQDLKSEEFWELTIFCAVKILQQFNEHKS